MNLADPLETLHPRSLRHMAGHLRALRETRLWLKILVAMALGITVGLLLGPSVGWVDRDIARLIGDWLALPGQIFLGVIQMIVVPLVFASIVRGLAASENQDQLRRLGWRLALYFVATTTVAVLLGLGIAYLVRPGDFVDAAALQAELGSGSMPDVARAAEIPSVPELVGGLLPQNPLGSMVEGQMLEIVIFAVIFGVALVSMRPEQSRPMLDLLGSLQQVCMTVVRWAMLLAPVAVFGLLAQLTSSIGLGVLLGLAVYVATTVGGLLALLLFYVVIAWVFAGKSPLRFLGHAREVQLLAFTTSSSAAVMPLSIQTAQEKLDVRPSIAQFVVPMGATINMDGTALYQAVATVFLAQVTGVELGFAALALIVVTAVGASIGAPSTPGVGIVLLAMILVNAGVPVEAIALIIGVDRILDMCRTTVNVTGDLTASVVMNRWVGGERSEAEERAAEAEHDTRRDVSGEDVILDQPAAAGG